MENACSAFIESVWTDAMPSASLVIIIIDDTVSLYIWTLDNQLLWKSADRRLLETRSASNKFCVLNSMWPAVICQNWFCLVLHIDEMNRISYEYIRRHDYYFYFFCSWSDSDPVWMLNNFIFPISTNNSSGGWPQCVYCIGQYTHTNDW